METWGSCSRRRFHTFSLLLLLLLLLLCQQTDDVIMLGGVMTLPQQQQQELSVSECLNHLRMALHEACDCLFSH